MKLILTTDATKYILFDGELTRLSPVDRWKAALLKLGQFSALGIAAIFIPILHFFLVPAALALGIFYFFDALSKDIQPVTLQPCHCVQCQNILIFRKLSSQNCRIKCEKCFAQYILEK